MTCKSGYVSVANNIKGVYSLQDNLNCESSVNDVYLFLKTNFVENKIIN